MLSFGYNHKQESIFLYMSHYRQWIQMDYMTLVKCIEVIACTLFAVPSSFSLLHSIASTTKLFSDNQINCIHDLISFSNIWKWLSLLVSSESHSSFYAPWPQVSPFRPQFLKAVRTYTPFRAPGAKRRDFGYIKGWQSYSRIHPSRTAKSKHVRPLEGLKPFIEPHCIIKLIIQTTRT